MRTRSIAPIGGSNLLMLLFFHLLFAFSLEGQTVYNYTLDTATVHIASLPTPIGSIYPPTNFDTITKPLVVEAFSVNPQLAAEAGDIHAEATGVNDVFFGGDAPGSSLFAAQATPIITKQTFDASDFPIYLETDVYIHENSLNYNECYFWIGDANYQSFCAPRSSVPSADIQEGILVGGWVNRRIVLDLQSSTEPLYFVKDTMDNATTVKTWYNYKAILDFFDGNLIIRDIRINDECAFNYPIVINQAPWLDNFRLALCVDDLAHSFTIITNYTSISADFEISASTICEGSTVNLGSVGEVISCHDPNLQYQWMFVGANQSTASQQNVVGLTFANSGSYPITLIINNTYEADTVTKTLEVISEPMIDLGNDTSICASEPLILDAFFPGATYLWSDNSTNSTLAVMASGSYWCDIIVGECVSRDSIMVEYEAAPNIDLGNDTILCAGSSLLLDAFDPNAVSYLWQNGSTESSLVVDAPGLYVVSVATNCAELTDSIEVNSFEGILSLDLGPDIILCQGDSVTLNASTENATDYLWQDGSAEAQKLVFSEGTYAVTISNVCSEASDTVTISSDNCCQLFMPNAFSPNDDGINDHFYVYFADDSCNNISGFSLKVFNRWGGLVYQSDNQTESWDGFFHSKKVSTGIYVWILQYSLGGQSFFETGDVTLIR